jgi:PD-(D/E)XK nuclease superfamily protein
MDLLFNGAKIKSKIFDLEGTFKDRLLTLFKAGIRTTDDGSKTFICDQDTLREFYLDGCDILAHVRKYQKEFFPTQGFELVGCEVELEIPVKPHVQFIGYVDIVVREKRTGKIIIFDLKTSKKGWFYEKKDPKKLHQLLLYKRFYAEQFGVDEDDIVVKFIILKRKIDENSEWANAKKRIVGFEPSHGPISVKKASQSFEQFISTAFADDGTVLRENLTPTASDKNCRFCPYRENAELCSDSYYQISSRR